MSKKYALKIANNLVDPADIRSIEFSVNANTISCKYGGGLNEKASVVELPDLGPSPAKTGILPGQTVKLKSGGPPMTVARVNDEVEFGRNDYGQSAGVECYWFAGSEKMISSFKPETLYAYDTPIEVPPKNDNASSPIRP